MIQRLCCGAALLVAFAAGCAHTTEPAPPANHPANPRAAEASTPGDSTSVTSAPAAPTAYTCPHHPRVMEAEPGNCPICGMKLVPSESRNTSPLRGVAPQTAPAKTSSPDPHEGHQP